MVSHNADIHSNYLYCVSSVCAMVRQRDGGVEIADTSCMQVVMVSMSHLKSYLPNLRRHIFENDANS